MVESPRVNPRWAPSVVLAAVAAHIGCGPSTPGIDGGRGADATVAVGTGPDDYEEIPREGGTVELVYGPQGGYHVWGRAWFQGLAPDVDVAFRVTRLDDGAVLHAPLPARRWISDGIAHGLTPLVGGAFVTQAQQVGLQIQCASAVVGRTVLFEASVRERATGRAASDAREVRVVDQDPSPSCR
jgi:hypothetical protein